MRPVTCANVNDDQQTNSTHAQINLCDIDPPDVVRPNMPVLAADKERREAKPARGAIFRLSSRFFKRSVNFREKGGFNAPRLFRRLRGEKVALGADLIPRAVVEKAQSAFSRQPSAQRSAVSF
jgi:hypothetical protein